MSPLFLSVSSYWKDLGYLLVYLTGRPDIQKEYIMKFLATNAFPLGVVACSDSISTDTHTKTLYLARLIREVGDPRRMLSLPLPPSLHP